MGEKRSFQSSPWTNYDAPQIACSLITTGHIREDGSGQLVCALSLPLSPHSPAFPPVMDHTNGDSGVNGVDGVNGIDGAVVDGASAVDVVSGVKGVTANGTNGVTVVQKPRSGSRSLPFLTDILGNSLNDRLLFAVPKSELLTLLPSTRVTNVISSNRGPPPPILP